MSFHRSLSSLDGQPFYGHIQEAHKQLRLALASIPPRDRTLEPVARALVGCLRMLDGIKVRREETPAVQPRSRDSKDEKGKSQEPKGEKGKSQEPKGEKGKSQEPKGDKNRRREVESD